ncbi:MAG: 50S ribosomal protein L5 [Kiritimatiellia bacterium]
MPALKEKYEKEAAPGLVDCLQEKNRLRLPRLIKVVVNVGMGTADGDAQKAIAGNLSAITGQKPLITKASKSISNFKVRKGEAVGAKVTLRANRMYEFLERLIGAALPRIRDFRGLPASAFDGKGNYTIGIKDYSIFPEIDPSNVPVPHGMDITIVTSAANNDEGRELLSRLGMPLAVKS